VTVVVGAAATTDIRAACEYYRRSGSGVEAQFLDEIDRVFGRLESFPRSAPAVADRPSVRRAPLRHFPFGVFYRLAEPDRIEVLRVIHTARSPETWPTD
jgi:toxin ParE1/3/4